MSSMLDCEHHSSILITRQIRKERGYGSFTHQIEMSIVRYGYRDMSQYDGGA